MPLQATSGAASYDAFGGGVPAVPNYIEEVFSTWLYTGNGSVNGISNGIDLTKGGLVWVKNRGSAQNHVLTDTARGDDNYLSSNTTTAATSGGGIYLGDGFAAIGSSVLTNSSSNTYASWTFREQPKFFDVVTYSGSSSTQNIAHNLGSVPGCIIVKRTSGVEDWFVYHTSLGNTKYLKLNTTGAEASGFAAWNNTSPTSTQFTVLGGRTEVNAAGSDYVAYLFAHNAGGFGLTGTDNVISCGSFTTNASGIATVTLGYEPQWVLIKRTDSPSEWHMIDNMRGFSQTIDAWLRANSSAAENSTYKIATPTATGFVTDGTNIIDPSSSFIYIAIRRGPMKVPTSGTSVFAPFSNTTSSPRTLTTNFVSDLAIQGYVNTTAFDGNISSRLQNENYMRTTSTTEEYTGFQFFNWASNTALISNDGNATKKAIYAFSRAPSYLDVVCYTGTGANRTIAHNLAAVPELMLVKRRSTADAWAVYFGDPTDYLRLNDPQAAVDEISRWNDTAPTSTVFTVGTDTEVNTSGQTYVNYLFATCAGVSKVGSYTGNGSTQTINCGFTSGARFVLIKRTDATGDWYTYDTARGMTVLTDPYLRLNSTAAEVATLGSVTTVSTGFALDATVLAAINASGGTYIFLAIA